MEIEIIIAAIILLALVFLASVDMAFSHQSDVSLRRISSDEELAEKKSSSVFLREILENRPRFRFAISSAIQVLLISFTVLLTVIINGFTSNTAALLLIALAIGLTATVLFRQIIPRFLVRNNSEKKLLILLPAVRPLYSISSAIVGAFTSGSKKGDRINLDATFTPDSSDERSDDNDDDFQALMEVGEAEGIIEEKERELIESVVEFGETRVGEIMTPRTEICAIGIESTIGDARDLIITEKYSRLPVYREKVDNIEGVIYVRDLLQAWSDGAEKQPIETIIRDAYFVPESKTAEELLKSMQQNHTQIAIVIDEYGGVAGLVTVEDILEEIVGEIEDEDTVEEEIIEIVEGNDGYYDVIGSTDIDKVERVFDVELDDEEYTTIAGMVTSEEGLVPKAGEKLLIRGLEIEILEADEKKISLLRLRKASEPDPKNVEMEG